MTTTIENDKKENYFNEGELDTNLLAENCPNFIDFIPSKACLDKLFKRMMITKENDIDKWKW